MKNNSIKLFSFFCVFMCCALIFCGCMGKNNNNMGMTDNNNSTSSSMTDNQNNGNEVKITLPAAMFESIDAAKEEAKQILNQEGVISAETAEDGSLNIVMTKEGHKKTLEQLKKSVKDAADEMQKDGGSDSIKKVTVNEDLSEAEITVSSEEDFKASSDNFQVFALGLKMLYYRRYNGDESAKATIKLRDEKTNEIFDTKIYPQE